MKSLLYILIFFTLISQISCDDDWNDHYSIKSDTTSVSNLNLYDYLKTKSEYSKFVEELEKTGLAEELTKNQNLTVWVFNNDQMTAFDSLASFSYLSDTLIMENQINHIEYTLNKLSSGLRLQALNGKYITIGISGSNYTVGDGYIVKGNQICSNGVVHEVSKIIEPRISIYNYIVSLGDDYSIIKKLIISRNDTVFDASNSTPVGVNKYGNTIYDSVFVIKNSLLDTVDFKSESSQVTLFLPSNEKIKQCIDILKASYVSISKTYSSSDSIMAINWIMRATMFNSLITNYGSVEDLTSGFGKQWRTTIQQINTSPKVMSNGYIYDISYVKIPNNTYLTRIKSLVDYYFKLSTTEKSEYFKFTNTSTTPTEGADKSSKFTDYTGTKYYSYLLIQGASTTDADTLTMEYNPILYSKLDSSYSLMTVPCGQYYLFLGFWSSGSSYYNIYFNDNLIAENIDAYNSTPWNYDRTSVSPATPTGSRLYDGTGGYVGIVNVTDGEKTVAGNSISAESGLATFRIKIKFSKKYNSKEYIGAYHWALIPTSDNY